MPFRLESNQDRRDTADELMDMADRARTTRKAAEQDGSPVARPMGTLQTCLLHTAYRINPERIEVVADPSYPSGEVLCVRYRSRVRQFHVLRTQWLVLERLAA
jgi:hypothetical protein